MTEKQKLAKLKFAFNDVIWMAIRYAHGKHTFAPDTVRESIKIFQEVFPDWKPKQDITIKSPDITTIAGSKFQKDYLHDLVNQNE